MVECAAASMSRTAVRQIPQVGNCFWSLPVACASEILAAVAQRVRALGLSGAGLVDSGGQFIPEK
jgi:hypothetical protein